MNIFKYLNERMEANNPYITATVTTLYPLTVKILPTDTAIPVVATGNLHGIKVGSRVLLVRYGDQLIAIAVIGLSQLEKCILLKDTTQSIATATTTAITFTSSQEDYDPLNMHSGTTNTSRITIPSDGIYQVNSCLRWETYTDDTARLLYLTINSNTIAGNVGAVESGGRSGNTISTCLNLEKDDYLELKVYQNSGTSLTVGGTSYNHVNFTVCKV